MSLLPVAGHPIVNEHIRSGQFRDALRLMDRIIQSQPDNVWLRLDSVDICRQMGWQSEAEHRLAAIALSPALGADVVAAAQRRLAAMPGEGDRWRLEVISDLPRLERRLGWLSPRCLEADGPIPWAARQGEGNDYRALVDMVDRAIALEEPRSPHILVVSLLGAGDSPLEWAQRLERQQYPTERITRLAIATDPTQELPEPARLAACRVLCERAPDIAALNTLIRAQQADLLVFLPPDIQPGPFLLARLARLQAHTDRIAQCFAWADDPRHTGVAVIEDFDVGPAYDWYRDTHPALRADTGNLVMPMARFRALRGLRTDLSGPMAFIELLYRFCQAGGYVVPAGAARPLRRAGCERPSEAELRRWLADQPGRLPDRVYRSPRLSLCLPAGSEPEPVVATVTSVLRDRFRDLELCVIDDGRAHSVLDRLQSLFGSDPRVRLLRGPGGQRGAVLNQALQRCRGVYVGLLRPGETLRAGVLAKFVDYLGRHPAVGCVRADVHRLGTGQESIHLAGECSRMTLWSQPPREAFRVFRRACWARTDGYREDVGMALDHDLDLKLAERMAVHDLGWVATDRSFDPVGAMAGALPEPSLARLLCGIRQQALWRQGLDRHWRVTTPVASAAPAAIQPVASSTVRRIVFWPNYTGSNPYQRLRYREPDWSGDHVAAGSIEQALQALQQAPTDPMEFHLYWLTSLHALGAPGTAGNTGSQSFCEAWTQFRALGGFTRWHVFQIPDRESEPVEWAWLMWLAERVDHVTCHTATLARQVEALHEALTGRVEVWSPPQRGGFYPRQMGSGAARALLGLPEQGPVMLSVGQSVRPDELDAWIDTLKRSWQEDANLHHLLCARMPAQWPELRDAALTTEQRQRLQEWPVPIDDSAWQVLFRAATRVRLIGQGMTESEMNSMRQWFAAQD